MRGERQVAGLWCHEVLAKLYDYLDGELASEDRSRVDDHLSGCWVCANFGGRASKLAKAIRERLVEADPISAGLERRLLGAAEADSGE